MKRAAMLALVLFAAAAAAQVRGVPASVTSMTDRRMTPGVPASVTSLGPNGFQGTATPFGTPPMRPPTTVSCYGGGMYCYPTTTPPVSSGPKRRHHHRGGYPYGYAYAPYYAYPYYPVTDFSTMGAGYEYLQPSTPEVIEEPAPPAPTIFERRPASRPYARDEARYEDEYRGPTAEAAPSSTIGVGEQETTVLVFADGRQMDIHNYAIVGQTLFNLDGTGPFKIKLAELNLGATEQVNEENGVTFKLPK